MPSRNIHKIVVRSTYVEYIYITARYIYTLLEPCTTQPQIALIWNFQCTFTTCR